jgi:hypothetical protein
MTRQNENQSYDQKKGSADSGVTGQKQGVPGQSDAEQAQPTKAGATIPEQQGCGPNVTSYPGLGD